MRCSTLTTLARGASGGTNNLQRFDRGAKNESWVSGTLPLDAHEPPEERQRLGFVTASGNVRMPHPPRLQRHQSGGCVDVGRRFQEGPRELRAPRWPIPGAGRRAPLWSRRGRGGEVRKSRGRRGWMVTRRGRWCGAGANLGGRNAVRAVKHGCNEGSAARGAG